MKLLATLLTTAVFMAATAHAEEAPEGPTIDGGVEMTINSDGEIAAGIGKDSSASQELGNINAGNISGNITETENATGNIAAGIGDDSCASQKVGSIGGKGSDC